MREVPDAGERYRRIALDYAGQSRTVRDATLILTGTNEARAELNRTDRDVLKAQGELSRQRTTVRTFQRRDLTVAEQKRLDRYRVGDAVLFRRAYRSLGVERGETYLVTRINGGWWSNAYIDAAVRMALTSQRRLQSRGLQARRGVLVVLFEILGSG